MKEKNRCQKILNGYKEYITEVLDFPKTNIGFKDISPLLVGRTNIPFLL